MKRKKIWGIWVWLCLKRQLHKPAFLAALLFLPLLAYMFHGFEQKDDGRHYVAVYMEDEQGEYENLLMERLQQQEQIDFYRTFSEEEMVKAVNSTKAECGIVIREGLKENVINRNYTHLFVLYTSPSSVHVALAKEILYAQFAWCFSQDLGTDVIKKNVPEGEINQKDCRLWLSEAISEYQVEGGKFHFQYETVGGKVLEEKREKLTQAFPVQGLIGIFIMVVGMFALTDVLEDNRKGICQVFLGKERVLSSLIQIFFPVILAALVSFFSLALVNAEFNPAREGIHLIGYSVLVCVVVYISSLIIRNEKVLWAVIPVYVMGCLVFCPVFFDVTVIFPYMRIVRYLFLPAYYLG